MITVMKTISVLLTTGLIAFAGCGGNDGSTNSKPAMPPEKPATQKKNGAAPTASRGTTITVGDSEFGEMLFDSKRQAIYIFENDPKGETVCYAECAEAWPPVLTRGEPRAGDGVRASLLGTVKRRDGKLQVTYAGKPLYSYAHEGPGEVRCHNVDLNGGFWWVVGPNGKRRP
jgi:predicted lipoprotein with Yx(FWY)xxD motif